MTIVLQPYKKFDKGYTLVELLVVISIMSLLSSILLASINVARAKANDTQKVASAQQVRTAAQIYYSNKGYMPLDYTCSGGNCVADSIVNTGSNRTTIEIENTDGAYEKTMQDMVNNRALTSIPHSPDPATPYSYFNYGAGTVQGALFGTSLIAAQPSTSGVGGSCRPNTTVTQGQTYNISRRGWNAADYSDTYYSNGTICTTDPYAATPCNGPTSNLCDGNRTTDYCICNPY